MVYDKSNDKSTGAGFTWSPQQQAIFADAQLSEGHTVVIARAGCGKTTTSLEATGYMPKGSKRAMLAFNKSIAKELDERAPPGVVAKSFHSFGYAAIRKQLGKVEFNDGKVPSIALTMYPPESDRSRAFFGSSMARLVSMAKSTLAGTPQEIEDMATERDIDLDFGAVIGDDFNVPEAASKVLDACAKYPTHVDYDDMIWLPIRLGLNMPKFDRLVVDETQDLNRAQVNLALLSLAPGGRICAVGDDRQAIYGFRGAASDVIPRLVEVLHATTLPLTITRRCGKAIVRVAQRYVPDFEAANDAHEGIVEDLSDRNWSYMVGANDFILSRSNAPLVQACMKFLAAGRPAAVAGRDVGSGLLALVKKSKASSVEALDEWLDDWRDKQLKRQERNYAAGKRTSFEFEDKIACLRAIADACSSVDEIVGKIGRLFEDDSTGKIVLSTVHKAKGLERDRVFVMWGTFKEYAARKRPGESDEELQVRQDRDALELDNLRYVAVTRAKNELYFVA